MRGRGLALALLACAAPLVAPQTALAQGTDISRLDPAVRHAIEQAEQRVALLADQAPAGARADALGKLAEVLLAHDQNEAATAVFDQALAHAPDRFALHYLRALARLGVGDVDAALKGLDRALLLDPDYAAAWIRRGELHLAQGDLGAARDDFGKARRMDPRSAAAVAGLGRTALQAGDAAAAAELLAEALLLQPLAGRLRTPQALALRQLGRTEEARAALAQRNDRSPELHDPLFDAAAGLRRNPAVIYERGRLLAERGDLAGALQALEEAVAMTPDEPVFLTEYGRVLLQAGRAVDAAPVLDQAAALAPRMPLAAELRARVALALGDRNLATQRLREALQLIPDADDLRVELARQRFRAGYFAEAGSEFSRLAARAEGAEFSYASYWAGIAYALAGRCAPALAALQAVFDASGGRDGWAMLGLARLGALCPVDPALRAQSLAWAENLYRQHPGVETAVTMALHAAAQGDFAQAVHLQQEAVTLATTNQETHEHLASLKTVLGSYQAKTMPDKAYLPGSGLLNIE